MTGVAERSAIVTGGTRGIGRGIALRLARDGVRPLVVFRRDQRAAVETLDLLRSVHPGAEAFQADVSVPEEAARVVKTILQNAPRIDALVGCHLGRTPAAKVHEIEPVAWATGIAENLGASFLIARAVLPAMIAQKFGRIVFVGSLAARGERGKAIYATAKSGLHGLARTIALEYAKDGITANVVEPGFVDGGAFLELDDATRAKALERIPMRRFGTVEEVAELVCTLVQPDAGYLTGQIIGIDGGAS